MVVHELEAKGRLAGLLQLMVVHGENDFFGVDDVKS